MDVHARKVVAGVLDAATGELRSLRAPTLPVETVAWLSQFPGPVRVAYEAGPTGYGLARACAAAGIGCTVAAPSKIQRAPADRVKTDRRDAERLARLLRLGELVAVRVPELHEEAARDLVRAREDARGELMRARHRLSKLLRRHGLVYDASAWTLAHDAWLRRQRFESRPLQLAFEESYAAAVQAKTRRDTLDQAIVELAAEPPQAAADAARRRDADAAGIRKRQVVQGKHCVTGQDGVLAHAKHGLHELVSGGGRNVLEAIEALGDVLETAALVELAQLHRGHAQIVGVPGTDSGTSLPQSTVNRAIKCQRRTGIGTVLPPESLPAAGDMEKPRLSGAFR